MKQPSFVLVWTLASVFGASGALVAQEPAAPRTVRARAAEAPKAAPQDPAASVRRELRKILAEVDQQDLSPEEKQLVRQAIERAAKKVAEANATPPLMLSSKPPRAAEPPVPPAPPVSPMVAQKLPKGAIVVQEVEGKPVMVQIEGKDGAVRVVQQQAKAADREVRTYSDKPVIVREGQPIDTKDMPRRFLVQSKGKEAAAVELEALKAVEAQRKDAVERAIKVAKESQDLQREIAVVRERAMVVRAKAEAERAKVEAERAAHRGGDGNRELREMMEQMRREMQELRQMVREMQKQPQPSERRRQASVVERAKVEGSRIAPARIAEAVVESPEVEIAETVEIVEVEAPKLEVRTYPVQRSGR
jgi:hypothetical protein